MVRVLEIIPSQCSPSSSWLLGGEIPIWRGRHRLVVPGQPLHIIQRGNNRQAVFFGEDDYHRFLSDVTQAAGKYRCAVHASVLMTNHIHLLVTPGEGAVCRA